MLSPRYRPFFVCLAVNFFAAVASSQEAPLEPPLPDPKQWVAQRAEEFASYRFEVESPERGLLTLKPTPILNWSNPERNTIYGATFIWTYQGRPELIGSAYGRAQ